MWSTSLCMQLFFLCFSRVFTFVVNLSYILCSVYQTFPFVLFVCGLPKGCENI
uniref:Uncharacterized protein n=1 Tax=Anguilla anguilla TaxID=7936 RepID=A0A0E9R9Y5_ANGAN